MKIWFAPTAEYLPEMVGAHNVVGAMNEVEFALLGGRGNCWLKNYVASTVW